MNSKAAWDMVLETLAQKQTNKKTVGGNQLQTEISVTTPLRYVAIGAAMASLPLINMAVRRDSQEGRSMRHRKGGERETCDLSSPLSKGHPI